MTQMPSPSDGEPRPPVARRTGLGGALCALEAILPGLADPATAADAEASARRVLSAIIERGAAACRPELVGPGRALLEAPSAGFSAGLSEFVTLLRRTAELQSGKTTETVLIVEDDQLFARSLELTLAAPGRRIVIAQTAAEARKSIKLDRPNLLILDLILPDGDGRSILIELRSDLRTAALPIFVVSARLGSQTKAECFALGADAYFDKPLDLESFGVAVGARLERHADQIQASRRDPITGLPNRAAFLEAVTRLRESSPPDTGFALAVLDLDHFRWIEETWGRQFSDNVLRRAGVRLAMALRQATVFARWDGAEFIALFAGRSAAEAGAAVDNALAVLRRVDFRPGQESPLVVTFSAGVVECQPEQSVEDAIAEGDRLRYIAKASGRNRVVTASAHAIVPVRRILLAEDDPAVVRMVSRSLKQQGFDVVDFPNGAEALANAASINPALIISDIEMPVLDGLGLLRGLREHPELRHVPVMMLTAMGDENYIVRAFELGADDYVLKPFSMREVVARVRRLLRRPSLAGIPVAS
jgi:diguanylate cyclase (GGDEF)-like protein